MLPRLRPDVVGTDALGCRAAARALAEADCHKALPAALRFLQAFPPERLGELRSLEDARLPSIRHFYAALREQAAGK